MAGSARFPKRDYRGPKFYPHKRTDGFGELVQDALSGFWFGSQYAVEDPHGRGLVDGRNGNVLDLDTDHELNPGNITTTLVR